MDFKRKKGVPLILVLIILLILTILGLVEPFSVKVSQNVANREIILVWNVLLPIIF